MKPEKVINVGSTHTIICDGLSRHDLLAWVNDLLKVNFLKVDDLCTGAAYCQLMHSLFPNHVPFKRVKLYTNLENEFFDNFKILQTSFNKLGVQKSIPINGLCKGKLQDNIEFLQWFKKFYEANQKKDACYDPIEARNGEPMGYGSKLKARKLERCRSLSGKGTFRPKESNIPTATRSLTKIHLKEGGNTTSNTPRTPNIDAPEIEVTCEYPIIDADAAGLDETFHKDEMSPSQSEAAGENLEVEQTNVKEGEIDNEPETPLTIEELQESLLKSKDENVKLRDKLAQMDGLIEKFKGKLETIQKTRDNFYHKLKDIGFCIKEAEDAGIATVETLQITNILLGNTKNLAAYASEDDQQGDQ